MEEIVTDVVTGEVIESTTTVVCECSKVLEQYLPALLDGLEHIYTLGLFIVGVAVAGTVCAILYNVIGKIFR